MAKELEAAVLSYISECDNPAPDYSHRRTLLNHLRELVGAPAEPKPRRRPQGVGSKFVLD